MRFFGSAHLVSLPDQIVKIDGEPEAGSNGEVFVQSGLGRRGASAIEVESYALSSCKTAGLLSGCKRGQVTQREIWKHNGLAYLVS